MGSAGRGSGIGASSTGGSVAAGGAGAAFGAAFAAVLGPAGALAATGGAGFGTAGEAGAPVRASFIASTIRSVAPSSPFASPAVCGPAGRATGGELGGGNGLRRISVGRSGPAGAGAAGEETPLCRGAAAGIELETGAGAAGGAGTTGGGAIGLRISVGRSNTGASVGAAEAGGVAAGTGGVAALGVILSQRRFATTDVDAMVRRLRRAADDVVRAAGGG